VRESNGAYVTATDVEIMRAVPLTGRLAGVFAEPAAATTIAGIGIAREKGILDANSNVLAMITGNGLKDIQGALRAVGNPIDVEPTLEAVLAIVEKN
jgi:threonine synthase